MKTKKKPDVRSGVAVRIFHKVGGEYLRRTPQQLFDAATKVIENRVPLNRRGVEVTPLGRKLQRALKAA